MSIINTIKGVLRSNRIRKQYERVENAIREKAQLASDMEFHRTMTNFYTERVMDINPNTDWWGFAEAKQKQHDHQEDFIRFESRIDEADSKVAAHKKAFLAAQKELDELPSPH